MKILEDDECGHGKNGDHEYFLQNRTGKPMTDLLTDE